MSEPTAPPPQPPSIPPAGPPAAAPAKKGMGPLAWVLVGCLGLIVLAGAGCLVVGFIAKGKIEEGVRSFQENPAYTAARALALVNPDIEIVDRDDEAGTVTLRSKESGQTMTVDLEDIQEGRVSFRGDEGETRVEIGEHGIRVTDGAGEATVEWDESGMRIRSGENGEEDVRVEWGDGELRVIRDREDDD